MRQAIKNARSEQRIFTHRAIAAAVLVVVLLSLVVARLVWLQIIRHDQYITASRENRLKMVPIPPSVA